MAAQVTYNAGRSYRIGKYRFAQGVTQNVSDAAVVDRCRKTVGFAVSEDLKAKRPRKAKAPDVAAVEKTVRPVASETEEAPRRKKRRSSE